MLAIQKLPPNFHLTPPQNTRLGHLFLALLALLLTLPGPGMAAAFVDDFSLGLRPTCWTILQSTPGFYSVDASAGAVRLAKSSTPTPGGIQNVSVRLNLARFGGPVAGDFATQIDFSDAVVPGPGLDQVELHASFEDGSIFYAVYDRSSGYNAHVWDGANVQGILPISQRAGTFAIARTGSTLSAYYNGTLLFASEKTSPLTGIDFVLQNNQGSDDPISVTFDHFSFTAASVPPALNVTALPNHQGQLQMTTTPGQSYTLEVSTNLVNWQPVHSLEAVQTNLVTLVDPTPLTSNPCRFYRVKVGLTPLYDLSFLHTADAGQFGGGLTPTISYPVSISGYSLGFGARNDAPYPEMGSVLFTGPAGSGLLNRPAEWFHAESDEAWYQSAWMSSPVYGPAGEWTVQFKGGNHTFTLADPQAASRLVVPVPTVAVAGGVLQGVSWSYRSPVGALLSARPAFITSLQVQIEGQGGRLYDSPELEEPGITSQSVSGSINWSSVTAINMAYDDSLGNHYVIFFRKS